MKVELLEFPGPQYAVKKTTGFLFLKKIQWLELNSNSSGTEWRDHSSKYKASCFSKNLGEVITKYVDSGLADGVHIKLGGGVSVSELVKMSEMAQNDEGMKDLLLKAKEFYILKK